MMILAVVFLVSACSSKDEEVVLDGQTAAEREGITDGPLDQIYQGDMQGPVPGTQADLVVNVGDRIFFGTDRYDLSGEARQTLDKQAAWLEQYPSLNVTVEGHADERGTREYNLALGERRANSVRNYLSALGIAPSRIQTISYGKERPAVPGADESAWAQNRRSVTKVD
ncbi:MAG: peptidoglycan-associated lipoprotein Pal [Rhodospirillales bacterium]|nr:peptidoglycan-associated lipoprotein Pal [Rhodospirillales bacterium]